MSDKEAVRVAMIASVVIAVFSLIVAPLLYFAPEGLWQIIRIFTGFYNIPVVTIVIVGLFAKRTPALAAKTVIIFHVIAYSLLKFALKDIVTLHFLHLYAVLFAIEIGIMFAITAYAPRETDWKFKPNQKVNLTPWRYAVPSAATLISFVVTVYLLFSPLGLAAGSPAKLFYMLLLLLTIGNILVWILPSVKQRTSSHN